MEGERLKRGGKRLKKEGKRLKKRRGRGLLEARKKIMTSI